MKRTLLILMLLLFCEYIFCQTPISGKVSDSSDNPIPGANVYLEGTYDGTSTGSDGSFAFETSETGSQTLVISMLGFQPRYETGDVAYLNGLSIKMVEAINALTGVTLTAGTFEAGDNSKVSVLKPLDIVTTAGTVGDFVGALQTLPGTSTVNEDGRLFIRGGDAGETQVFIDGLRVFQPFNATANNIPTRGRFSPFHFKGITFSTGGYSAEYGQALSSVLLLNSIDSPDQEKTDISILSVGGGIGHTEIWGDQSLSINMQYIDLAPYEALIPSDQGVRWNRPYESVSGEAVFRSKGEMSMFKLYTSFNRAVLDIEQEDINFEDFVRFDLTNKNLYFNTSYKLFLDREWALTTGAAISWDANDIGLRGTAIETKETASHLKLKLKKNFSNRLSLALGTEHFITDYGETFLAPKGPGFDTAFTERLWGGFAESDIFFSNDLALKLGVRAEHSGLIEDFTVSPRVSLAYKSSEKGQFSLAYGDFYQNPRTTALRYDNTLDFEKTSHYILNYQYLDDGKTFRAETYYKDYDGLVKFDTEMPQFDSRFNNSGGGYVSGLDIFWRDNKGVKNLDYWVSYGYLDTERDFRNFRERARPNFAPKHNLSVVTKYWINQWRSQVGLSYTYASGRPYDNPNTAEFQAERTKAFQSLSLSWAYLIDQQKILYFSVSNMLGFNNINDYQYANSPGPNGNFGRRAIRSAADSFFFVGFFWTISTDNTSNQLDNL
ncbi:TonB-dependent receptor [Pricia sp. S334]|uniref:TonB-dependent receptor n=1 Tax=Pricia mediterranea TaxID=3076079 RepID=A0ABU3L2B4_9FLAO|nr:TonB-dependent receptor [Pricia sp. S334]MDT7827886.1 TonB-dependent receptor [Pricia sp. S334]